MQDRKKYYCLCFRRRNRNGTENAKSATPATAQSDPQPDTTQTQPTQPEATQPSTYDIIPDHMVQALPLPDPSSKPVQYEDVLQPGAMPTGYYNIPKQGSGYQNVEASKAVTSLGSGHYLDVGSGQYEEIPSGYELLAKKSEYENAQPLREVKVYADLK